MIKTKKLFFFIWTVFLSLNMVMGQNDPNTRDLLILTKWFEGEFDNDSQIWFEGRRGISEDAPERHKRIHTTHTKIKADFLGSHVFYVEEYINDDVTKISRQRIVSFCSMAPAQEIKMIIYFLKDGKKYIGAQNKPNFFDNLKQEDLSLLNGCHVYFKKEGEQYFGSMRSKECQFGEGDLKRYSVHDMVVSKNEYWRVDRSFLVKNDTLHKGHINNEPYKMRKASNYLCDIKFYEKSYAEPTPNDVAYINLKIHNQGGFSWVMYPKENKKYGIQLREKEYPFYASDSDFFMMRFIKEGNKRSTIIVTAEPRVKKVSFNNGWASCSCKKIE